MWEPRLRIAQLIQSVDVQSGGTSTAFLNVVEAVAARPGLRVRAFTQPPPESGNGDPAWAVIRGGVGEWELVPGVGRGPRPGALGRAVVSAVERGEVDLLHLHGVWSPDLLGAGLACLRKGVPYLWEPHGMLVREAFAQKRWKKEVLMALGMRRALRGAAGLVFVTAEERDHSLVPAGVGAERRHVIPLPVRMPGEEMATAEFRKGARARFGLPEGEPCIVFMGRLHPVKRVELTLRAAAVLSKEWPGLRVLLIGGGGDGYVRGLKGLAAELGLNDRAVFAGWVRGEEKWAALAAGEVLTLNSLHENFGFVAVEALCVGTLPVLTANLALAAELGAGGVGVVAEPEAESLAWSAAIGRNRAEPVAARGRAWVAANLSLEAVGLKFEALYRTVLSAKGRA